MKTYNVTIDLNSLSYEVEAESEEDALSQALEMLEESYPDSDLLSGLFAFAEEVE